jgi:hypothetical protein
LAYEVKALFSLICSKYFVFRPASCRALLDIYLENAKILIRKLQISRLKSVYAQLGRPAKLIRLTDGLLLRKPAGHRSYEFFIRHQ